VLGFPGLGTRGLALALTVGAALEAAWLAWALRASGVRLLPSRGGRSPELSRMLRQWLPMMAGAVLMASSTVVDQTMAAALLPGSVARLEYGNRLVAVVTSLGSGVLGVAVVPYFSQLVSRGDLQGLAHVVRRWVWLIAAASVPIVAALTVWSATIVRVVYERGSFTAADTEVVATVQALLALQVPFYVAGIVLVRLVAALGATTVLTWISLSNTLLNAVLNLVLIRYMGVAGIALATSVMYLASFTMLILYVTRRHTARRT
jgi:putative peptidoglycan lipid II flippase